MGLDEMAEDHVLNILNESARHKNRPSARPDGEAKQSAGERRAGAAKSSTARVDALWVSRADDVWHRQVNFWLAI
jgi:hypothetical protein